MKAFCLRLLRRFRDFSFPPLALPEKWKGMYLSNRFEKPATPGQQIYAIQYFAGSLDCTSDGFTVPHADRNKAQWAISEFKNAIQAAEKRA